MNDEFETDVATYNFNYSNNHTGEAVSMTRTFENEFITWDEVLEQFLSFMSACYGYDIRQYVTITDKPTYHVGGTD